MPPRTSLLEPCIIYLEWCLEHMIGSLGEETRQHLNTFVSLVQHIQRRSQFNLPRIMLPDFDTAKTTFPCGMLIIGNGYALLIAKKVSHHYLTIQCNGHDGGPCPSPHISSSKSIILHLYGTHTVIIDNCACPSSQNIQMTAQYLRLGLWPSTLLQPKTAVTIYLLDFYHQLMLQSKVNLYDFY